MTWVIHYLHTEAKHLNNPPQLSNTTSKCKKLFRTREMSKEIS